MAINSYGDDFPSAFQRKFNRGIGLPGQEGDFMGGPISQGQGLGTQGGPVGDQPPWGSGGNPGPMPLPPRGVRQLGSGGMGTGILPPSPSPAPGFDTGGSPDWDAIRNDPSAWGYGAGIPGASGMTTLEERDRLRPPIETPNPIGPPIEDQNGGGGGPMPVPDGGPRLWQNTMPEVPIYNQNGVRMNEPPAKQWTQEGWQAELAKLQNPGTPQSNPMGIDGGPFGPPMPNNFGPQSDPGPMGRTPGGPAGPGGMRELPIKRINTGQYDTRGGILGPGPNGKSNATFGDVMGRRRGNTWGGDGQETQNPGGGGFNFTNQNRGLGNAQGEWKGWGNPDNLKLRKF